MDLKSREIIFVTRNFKMGSSRLRAVQIQQELIARGYRSRTLHSAEGVKGGILVFLKGESLTQIESAKARGNLIIVDLIDSHQRTFNWPLGIKDENGNQKIRWIYAKDVDPQFFDGLLFVNSHVAKLFSKHQEMMPCATIFHPWDERFGAPNSHEKFSIASLGHSIDRKVRPNVEQIHLKNHVLDTATIDLVKNYSCHLSIRDSVDAEVHEKFGDPGVSYYSKSNIKVSTAAACGANIVSSQDPGSKDLLHPDYPFWYDPSKSVAEYIEEVGGLYGTQIWLEGLEMMRAARARTTTARVVDDYLAYFSRLI